MHLLRRCGLLLIGVCLERDSSATEYRPTFHTHVLGKKVPVVSLTLAQPLLTERTQAPQSIQISYHQDKFEEAASRLRRQALLPIEGPLTLELALDAYRDYICRPTSNFPVELYEDMILLAAWCGRIDKVSDLIESSCDEISSWPPQIISSLEGVDSWVERVKRMSLHDVLSKEVETEISSLNIADIPAEPLI